MKTAVIIGSTGLVGSCLLRQLVRDDRFSRIVSFGRRASGVTHQKLEELVIDFDSPEYWQHRIKGDILFSTLGTTIKQAGSRDAQYKVDFDYQLQFAEAAARNGVPAYVLVSSSGANANSPVFYSRIKGQLERAVKQLPFARITILQPSLLTGKRNEERTGERLGYYLLSGLNRVGLLKKYRPIEAPVVARAMIEAGIYPGNGSKTYALDEIFKLAAQYPVHRGS